ncbi:hypothetical protein P43SY_000850 [Pythium insidiosum]|uniref:Uncharacterized protein n=1 Tax=Pythium insidiosum TaxID=114742 RepID=A0AAD5LVK9_PYTIN|nr:hypothetical protein P43SY_000850 [Pythium insidiosum]
MAEVSSSPADEYRGPTRQQQAPQSLMDFAEMFAPILKYYVVLLFFWYVAKRFNSAVEREAALKSREQKRPELSTELLRSSSDEEEEDDDDDSDDVHEELITDGKSDLFHTLFIFSLRRRKNKASGKTKKRAKETSPAELLPGGKSHPLFEGLKKVEEELRQQQQDGTDAGNVSWNELHMAMLKRYKDKYPDHGPRVADASDDYDDEFKALLAKHNIDPEQLKNKRE